MMRVGYGAAGLVGAGVDGIKNLARMVVKNLQK